MPEGLLEQPENSVPMMDVYSPEGTKGKVPFAQWGDYQKQGFKPAVRVTSPSGTGGWLPSDKVGDYTKNHGFKLGPPEQQKLSPAAPAYDPAKDKSLTDQMGNGMPTQEDLNPTAEQHPVIASALNRAGQIVKGTVGLFRPPETTAEKASLIAGPAGPIITRLIGGQVEAEKQAAPQVKEQFQAARNVPPGNAGIKALSYARAGTTALSTLNPFATGSVANVNKLENEGKPDQAAGEGITDALALATGLKKPAKVAGNVASDTLATVKDAVPAIARPTAENSIVMRGIKNVKTAINPVDNMTAGELATKAVRPRNSKTNFPAELETALPDTKRALQNAGVDQGSMTLHDVLDAATQAKKDVWAEYEQNHSGPAGELQIDTSPIADAMLSKITPRMRTQQPSLVKQIEANAAEYSGKSMAAKDLEQRVGEANNETRGIEAKYLTDKNAAKLDPSNAALFAERDTARQLLLSKLDEATGPGAADLRKRYGNLNSFQDVVSRRIPVADRAAPMNLGQIMSRLYGATKIAKGIATFEPGSIAEGATSIWYGKNADLMNNPNELAKRAFNKTAATPAARPYVAPPTPAIRGLLSPGPTEFGEQRTVPGSNLSLLPSVPPQGREGLLPAASRIDENGRVQYLTSPAEPGAARAPIARPNQEQPAAPIPLKTTEPPQGAPAAEQPITDRRVNPIQRKLVSEMSPEERGQALLTSEKTGLPNRRAFDESGPAKAVAMSDADGLKALNDKFGYDAGDALLKAKADALKEAGLDAYHEKGDEFLYRGDSPTDLQAKLDKARDILRNKTISVEMNDGRVLQFKGADFSYGTAENLSTAETRLKANKSQREAAGERARGQLRGITEVGPEAGQENLSGTHNSKPPRIARPNQ